MTKNATLARMPFDAWLAKCTPSRWAVSVTRTTDGASQTIDMPDDREIGVAILRTMGPGSYEVQPALKIRGRLQQIERNELGLAQFQRIETTRLDLNDAGDDDTDDDDSDDVDDDGDDVDAVDESSIAEDPAVRDAKSRAAIARAAAAEARAQAERAQHDAARAEAESRARQFAQQSPAGSSPVGMAEVLSVLRQMQEASDARMASLLARLMPAKDARPALAELREQLTLFAAVRDMVRGDQPEPPPPPDSTAATIREIRQAVADVLPLLRRDPAAPGAQPPRSAPLAVVPASTPAAASTPATSPVAVARVRAFVETIARELMAGAAPESVADRMSDDVGLLPASVRTPLDDGDWAGAWAGCQAIAPEETAQVAPWLSDDTVKEWLQAFAQALAVEEDEHK